MKFFSTRDVFPDSVSLQDFERFLTDERLWALCDLIPDGLILVNHMRSIIYMNIAAESMNEVSRKVLIGQSLNNLISQSQISYGPLMDDLTEGVRTSRTVSDNNEHSYTLLTKSLGRPENNTSHFLILIRPEKSPSTSVSRVVAGNASIPALTSADNRRAQQSFITCPITTVLIEQGLRTMAQGSRLLILGESGVGKSQFAKHLHRQSEKRNQPFVHINCASIPDTLFESEMFGYERGSFTGASNRGKKGLIEEADGGTLFLDEISEIPLQSQAKILQVLEEGLVQRIGSTTPRQLRIQVIAATNCDLQHAVKEGRFRQDLYYRLSVITLRIPPLRERKHLLPLLIEHFLDDINNRRPLPLTIDDLCRQQLTAYPFPGNIRELQNIIEYLSVVCKQNATIDTLPLHQMDFDHSSMGFNPCTYPPQHISTDFGEGFDLRQALQEYESKIIQSAIEQAGTKRGAARLLNIDIATVVRKTKKNTSE